MTSELAPITTQDPVYDSARDWYSTYDAHVTTDYHGDVGIQAFEPWLEQDDNDEYLNANYPRMSEDEREKLRERAEMVWRAARVVEAALAAAVKAWRSRDLPETLARLEYAAGMEGEHGDFPATRDLRRRLLLVDDED